MSDRKLATIEIIKDIQPIVGADAIEVATVRGWQVVVGKNDFNVGDLCVYCEVDSFLPIKPEFEFLRKGCYKKLADGSEGFRLKTVRLRGQISQGICFPISILPNEVISLLSLEDMIGMDATDALGIVKYDPPVPANLAGTAKGNFPSFIRKTDEERLQNMEWILTEYADTLFYVTEKIDGTSFTAYLKDGVFGVCSRNLDLCEPEPFVPGMIMCPDGIERPKQENTHWKVAKALKLEEQMREFGENIALQGELIGEGIQKNRYGLKGQTVLFFNIFDIDKYKYYRYDRFTDRIFKFGLKTVPIVSHVTGFKLLPTMNEMLKYAEDFSVLNPKIQREGVVIRPYDEIETPKHGRLSFKIISNKFLLKNED